ALILSGGTLYGTASQGGSLGLGAVFALNTDGTGLTSFNNLIAAIPNSSLVLSGYSLYGTAFSGGDNGKGSVFSVSFLPKLTLSRSDDSVVLMWPTNVAGFSYAGFTLETTTNLISPVWTTNLPAPVLVNGQNTVTNPINGTQQFFRLSQ